MKKEEPEGLAIYRASAGSGKTFLLTLRYLELLFQSPEKYREILAVTFTNKATAEMKTRILEELRKMATGADSAYMTFFISRYAEKEISRKAHYLYRSLLHDYSHFSITTIDKFVQKIIRSFAYEIGLDAGYKLELNTGLVKEALVEKMYEQVDKDSHLLQWLIALAKDRLEDGRSWDFTYEMLQLANEIFKEQFQEFEQAIHDLKDPEQSFEQLRNKLYAQKNIFEKQVKELGECGIKLLQQYNLEPENFSYGNKGFINWFAQAQKGKIAAPSKRFLDAINSRADWTTKKTGASIQQKVDILYEDLNNLMHEVKNYFDQHYKEYCTYQAIAQNFYMLNLLRVMAMQLAGYRDENNALLISDTHALLRALTRENDAPYILEKAGSQYQHFLMDEFQDTSVFQWENFLPLIRNSIADGNFNMVVGDVKQAIYRWRNGDWRLLLKKVKQDIGEINAKEYALQENYRSAINIIHFNNFLFYHAPKILQQQLNFCLQDITDESLQKKLSQQSFSSLIEQAYEDSYQYQPETLTAGGNIEVRFMPVTSNKNSTRKKEAREQINAQLPAMIEKLILEKNYQPGQITLLTRTNTEAREIIDLLIAHQAKEGALSYDLISSEALLIAAGQSVQLLLAAMETLNNPQNTLCRAQLIYLHCRLNNLDTELEKCFDVFSPGEKNILPEAFLTNREKLKGLPLSELIEDLIFLFQLNNKPNQVPYLLAFRDVVAGFNRGGEQNLADFLTWWKEEGNKLALQPSPNRNAVEVMTIHKSKGLAFDVVIIPYCDWELTNSQNVQLWCDMEGTSFSEIKMAPVRMKKELAQTQFAYAYFEELLFQYMDGLNLLYVALTRARQELIIMAPSHAPEKESINSIAGDLILNSLLSTSDLPEIKSWRNFSLDFLVEQQVLFIQENSSSSLKENNNDKLINLMNYPQFSWTKKINTTTANNWWNVPEKENAGATERRFGQLMHRTLAALNNEKELPQLLQKWVMEGILNETEKQEIQSKLQIILQDKIMQQWLNNQYTVMNEKDILTPQDGLFRPDKVLLHEKETIIIDFKFTKEKKQEHRRQLQNYKQLLQQMNYPNIKAYLYYGFLHEAEEV